MSEKNRKLPENIKEHADVPMHFNNTMKGLRFNQEFLLPEESKMTSVQNMQYSGKQDTHVQVAALQLSEMSTQKKGLYEQQATSLARTIQHSLPQETEKISQYDHNEMGLGEAQKIRVKFSPNVNQADKIEIDKNVTISDVPKFHIQSKHPSMFDDGQSKIDQSLSKDMKESSFYSKTPENHEFLVNLEVRESGNKLTSNNYNIHPKPPISASLPKGLHKKSESVPKFSGDVSQTTHKKKLRIKKKKKRVNSASI